jgi:hypothetical protein
LGSAATHGELLLHQEVLRHDATLLERAIDEQQQVIGIDGLRQEVHRPFFHGGDGVLDAAVCGHHDDGNVGVDFLGGAEHAEPVPFGEAKIGEDDRRLGLLQQADGFRLVARLEDGVVLPLQRMPQHGPE